MRRDCGYAVNKISLSPSDSLLIFFNNKAEESRQKITQFGKYKTWKF